MTSFFLLKFNKSDSQAGVTLLLAVMIMSGITLITITVGFFAVQEIRASRASYLSEPAIIAAETAGEQGIWNIKRELTSLSQCSTAPITSSTQLGNGSGYNACRRYGTVTIDLEAGTPFSFYLYNPNDREGDFDLDAYPFRKLRVTYVSGSQNIYVAASRLTGTSIGSVSVNSALVSQDINISPVATNTEGRVKVTLTSPGDAVVEVTSFSDTAGTTEIGLPDYPTIQATGCQAGGGSSNCGAAGDMAKRSIEILVPQ
jgi:hypothetical protein